MADWVERLILRLTPSDHKPVVVTDSDGILGFVEFQKRLQDLGFKLIWANSGLSFRFQFELRGRKQMKVMFILNSETEILPDIRVDSSVVTVDLHEVFPNLDRKALLGLGFNAFTTIESFRLFATLSYENSVRFLLENLYQVDLSALSSFKSKERVMAILISVILHRDPPNKPIVEFLRQLATPYFGKESSRLLDRTGLVSYIQSQWELIVTERSELNFGDPALERVVQPLFLNKSLTAHRVDKHVFDALPASLALGFTFDSGASSRSVISTKLSYIEERSLTIQNQQRDFFDLAPHLAELGKLVYELGEDAVTARYRQAIRSLSDRFQIYVRDSYWTTHNLSGIQFPSSIHKIQDFVRAQNSLRRAFVVLDGMNLWQWWILREKLLERSLEVADYATFSWLPSITAWSRQALFRGAKPDLSLDNSKEDQYFREYWVKAGYQKYQISYSKFGVSSPPIEVGPDVVAAAFVSNDLDEMMHATIMGSTQLYADTIQWVASSGVVSLIERLKNDGFLVCVTTDHGNIETTSRGTIALSDRQLSRSRSKRHIEFISNEDALKFRATMTDRVLSVRDTSVYLTDETSFTSGGLVVTHGGSHILEMLIPVGIVK